MPKYSESSLKKLETVHPVLRMVFMEVVRHFDNTIIFGFRGEGEQNKAFEEGKSKLRWPESKHNHQDDDGEPMSLAIDAAPYPIDWNDIRRFYYFAGLVLGIAKAMGVEIRWGGDWDKDTAVNDQKFNDLVHFEIVLKEA